MHACHVAITTFGSVENDQPTTSNVVTPKSFFLSYTPAAFKISAAMGTVELTGLEIMLIMACSEGYSSVKSTTMQSCSLSMVHSPQGNAVRMLL